MPGCVYTAWVIKTQAIRYAAILHPNLFDRFRLLHSFTNSSHCSTMLTANQIKLQICNEQVSGALVLHIKRMSCIDFATERKKICWKGKHHLLNAIYRKRKTFFVDFGTAAALVQPHHIKSKRCFTQWRRKHHLGRMFLPARPDVVYKKKGWTGWDKFLARA